MTEAFQMRIVCKWTSEIAGSEPASQRAKRPTQNGNGLKVLLTFPLFANSQISTCPLHRKTGFRVGGCAQFGMVMELIAEVTEVRGFELLCHTGLELVELFVDPRLK